jgi:hypothetical protein
VAEPAVPARVAFAHDATVRMDLAADIGAPGAAITVALCGHWEHEPPCPLAPHHTSSERDGDDVRLRVLFATEPSREAEVRERIAAALAGGELVGLDGRASSWTLLEHQRCAIGPDEAAHAARLAAS